MNRLFASLIFLAAFASPAAYAETQPGPGGEPPPMGEHGGVHKEWENKSVTRAEALEHEGKHFDRVDANHDGVLSPEERKAAHAQMRERREERREGRQEKRQQ